MFLIAMVSNLIAINATCDGSDVQTLNIRQPKGGHKPYHPLCFTTYGDIQSDSQRICCVCNMIVWCFGWGMGFFFFNLGNKSMSRCEDQNRSEWEWEKASSLQLVLHSIADRLGKPGQHYLTVLRFLKLQPLWWSLEAIAILLKVKPLAGDLKTGRNSKGYHSQ